MSKCAFVHKEVAVLQGALSQARRALRPDGLLLAAMMGGDTLQVPPLAPRD